jgi:hypothetical protein
MPAGRLSDIALTRINIGHNAHAMRPAIVNSGDFGSLPRIEQDGMAVQVRSVEAPMRSESRRRRNSQ